jgi:LysR family glycine cleavage system transcriptional activator
MTRRLPPLKAVRTFEAAARHLSFTKAANELCVTAAAVSQQIKILESYLGVQLFRRQRGGLALTDPAQHCLEALCGCLDDLADIFARLDGRRPSNLLNVRASPSLASGWLLPRLHRFQSKHPLLDLRLLTSTQIVCLDSPDIDVAITYTVAPSATSRLDCLMLEEIYPVCSPRLVPRGRPLSRPEHLGDFPLIHDETLQNEVTFPTWETWLRRTRAVGVDGSRGLRFSLSSMAIQAAVEGRGILLGRSVLVAPEVEAGRLVRPIDVRHPARFAYAVETRDGARASQSVADFVDWLHAEAAQTAGNVLPRRRRRATTRRA